VWENHATIVHGIVIESIENNDIRITRLSKFNSKVDELKNLWNREKTKKK
jgi:hypothetical protein